MPPASTEDLPIPVGRYDPDSYEVTAFSLVLVCMRSCVCPPRVEFLFPSLVEFLCSQTLLTFKATCSEGVSSHCQTPRLGNLMWGSEFWLLSEGLCDITISQFEGAHLVIMGFVFINDCASCTISL